MKQAAEFCMIIKPSTNRAFDYNDLVSSREVLYFLAWRNVLVRFKQTILGVAWAVVRPLVTVAIFTFIFGKVARFDSGGVPYAVLVLSGLLPWQFFAEAFQYGSLSLVSNAPLISKIYFPRVFIPASFMVVPFFDFVVSLFMLGAIMAYYKFVPSVHLIFLPLFFVWASILTLGLSFLFSALNVKYRDIGHAIPFLIRIGIYVTPIGFSSAILKSKWRLLMSINPLTGVVDGFRWSLLGQELYIPGLCVSLLMTAVFFLMGALYFKNTEQHFTDVI